MNGLRYRLTDEFKQGRERERQQLEERDRLWSRQAARLELMDAQDEAMMQGGRMNRPSRSAEQRGIKRLFRLEADVMEEAYATPEEIRFIFDTYGATPAELRNRMWSDLVDQHYQNLPVEGGSDVPSDGSLLRADVRDNMLYDQWLDQLDTAYPVRTYPVYALYVCLKAALALLTTRTKGYQYLEGLHDSSVSPWPNREDLIAFKLLEDFTDKSPEWFLSHATQIPGLLGVAETLMIHYSDFVRAERERLDNEDADVVSSTPLPDDPSGEGLSNRYVVPYEIRLENAVQARVAGEGGVKQIARKYDVPRDKLFETLRERGLLERPGGDRRG